MLGAERPAARREHGLPVRDRGSGQARVVQALPRLDQHGMRLGQPQQVAGDPAEPASAAAQRLIKQRISFQLRPDFTERIGGGPRGIVEHARGHQPAHRFLDDRMDRDHPGAGRPVDHDKPRPR